jgi:hypothetical protein
MRIVTVVGIIALLAGCAPARTSAPATQTTQTFVGEVWTWDERDSVVTIMEDGGRLVRVKVDPETLRTVRLHQYMRLPGTQAPPADLVHTTQAAGPVNPVPKGQPEIVEVPGTVTTVDPSGRLALTSERGPLHVWVAQGAEQRFQKGAPVIVRISVQPVDLVPATSPAPATPAPVGTPAAPPTSEPGDHAVVTGRIIGINPGNVLVVESPTGPIQVLSADVSRYKIGDAVQVRTSVRTRT